MRAEDPGCRPLLPPRRARPTARRDSTQHHCQLGASVPRSRDAGTTRQPEGAFACVRVLLSSEGSFGSSYLARQLSPLPAWTPRLQSWHFLAPPRCARPPALPSRLTATPPTRCVSPSLAWRRNHQSVIVTKRTCSRFLRRWEGSFGRVRFACRLYTVLGNLPAQFPPGRLRRSPCRAPPASVLALLRRAESPTTVSDCRYSGQV